MYIKPKLKIVAAVPLKQVQRQLIAKGYRKLKQAKYRQEPEQEGTDSYENGLLFAAQKVQKTAKNVIDRKVRAKKVQTKQTPANGRSVHHKMSKKVGSVQRREKAVQKSAQVTQKTIKGISQLSQQFAAAVIKTAVATGKAIVSAIAASAPVLLIVVGVAVIAAMLASSLGIFFSSETGDANTKTVRQVVEEISAEFSQHIEKIAADNLHDEIEVRYQNNGILRTDNWVDILAVFAVKTTTSDFGMDVLTMDGTRINLLKEVFWDMHMIEYSIEDVENTQPVLDEEGNQTGEVNTTYTQILHINIVGKSAREQSDSYGFSNSQLEQLSEILSGEYNSYWASLIGMISMVGDGTGVVGTGHFTWPSAVSDYVTSPFGARPHPITGEWNYHTGIDIAAGLDTSIFAVAGGTVTFAGWHWSYGYYVEIDHGNASKTRYAHCNMLLVSVGDAVEQGSLIALVGSTGVSTGPHLHFEVFVNGSRMDPLQFFGNYTTAW